MSTTKLFTIKTTLNFYQKKRLVNGLVLFVVCLLNLLSFGQTEKYEVPAFTLAQKGNENVVLYRLNSTTGVWKAAGSTGRSRIKSLAVDSKNEILYAIDEGKLGTLNPNTGGFSLIGEIGAASGAKGNVKIDNIHGLAYDANQDILYATHRTNSFDLLLKINPKTGKIITKSMINSKGQKADYKELIIETFYFGRVYESKNFTDLAYDNERKILYIVHTYFSKLFGINSFKNIDEQNPVEDFRISPIKNLADVAIDKEGRLFAVFSNNQISKGDPIIGGGVTLDFGELDKIITNGGDDLFFFGLDFYKPPTACGNNFQLNNSPMTNAPKSAINVIESSAVINVHATFIAGRSINLNNDFEVTKASNFEAIIDSNPCK